MKVLVDAGPLVAYFDRREILHDTVAAEMTQLHPPLITCEPVLTEVCFLLQRRIPDGVFRLETWLSRGLLQINFSLGEYWGKVLKLMNTYSNLPMSLADACLVAMYENESNGRIITFDHHFNIYRTSQRRVIKTIGLD